jgi:integration host factor subunit alpha
MRAMTKADIARSIHQQAGVSETEAADLLERIFELLRSTLQQEEPIIITGFGKFTVRMKQPRKGRNRAQARQSLFLITKWLPSVRVPCGKPN